MKQMRSCDFLSRASTALVLLLFGLQTLPAASSKNIIVGDDPSQFNLEWVDGACYLPIQNVRVGDTVEFRFAGHNVHKMKSKEAFITCRFGSDADSELVSFSSPYKYTVTAEDAQPTNAQLTSLSTSVDEVASAAPYRSLYFACSIGAHCLGKQRVRIDVDIDFGEITSSTASTRAQEESPPDLRRGESVSKFLLNVNDEICSRIQNGDFDESEMENIQHIESTCAEPVKEVADGGKATWFRSCLSPPFTLTPGGVVNQAVVVHYPFPTDHRVVLGNRIWEFVMGDLDNLQSAPVKQLYIHHILGDVIQGNGAESINRDDEDASFPFPYGRLTGDFGDIMTFHIIDLRETGDNYLPCLECRCKDEEGTYNDFGGSGGDGRAETGGVNCCSNCTSLTYPTIDYRMRYNVTWSEVPEGEPIIGVVSITTDMALAVDSIVEWDVPSYENLPESQRHPTIPNIQVLERIGTLRDVFGGTTSVVGGRTSVLGGYDYDMFEIHRCFGHMHIGGIEAFIRIAETDELICNPQATYGDDLSKDKGFLISIGVTNFDPPVVLPGDTEMKVTMHYNASELHTGVMGLLSLFVSDHAQSTAIHHDETALTIDLCETFECDVSIFPDINEISLRCEDDITTSQVCLGANVCTCEEFLSHPFVKGGCDEGAQLELPAILGGQNIPVEYFCAKSCGCKHLQDEEERNQLIEKEIQDQFQQMYRETCRFATKECRQMLSNLYTCSKYGVGDNVLDSLIFEALVELHHPVEDKMNEGGTLKVLERAKLGDKRIQRLVTSDINKDVLPCVAVDEASFSSGSTCGYAFSVSSLAFLLLLSLSR